MANKLVKHILDKIVTKLTDQTSPFVGITTLSTQSIESMAGDTNALQIALSSSRCVDDIGIYKHNRITESKNISGLIDGQTDFKEEHTTPYEKRYVFEVDVVWQFTEDTTPEIHTVLEIINNSLLGYDVISDIIKDQNIDLSDYTIIERTSLIPTRDERVLYTTTHAKYKVFFKIQTKILHNDIFGSIDSGTVNDVAFRLESTLLHQTIFLVPTGNITPEETVKVSYSYIDDNDVLVTVLDEEISFDINELRLKLLKDLQIISVKDISNVLYNKETDYVLEDAEIKKEDDNSITNRNTVLL